MRVILRETRKYRPARRKEEKTFDLSDLVRRIFGDRTRVTVRILRGAAVATTSWLFRGGSCHGERAPVRTLACAATRLRGQRACPGKLIFPVCA